MRIVGEISETAIEEKNKQVRRAEKIVSHDKLTDCIRLEAGNGYHTCCGRFWKPALLLCPL